MAKARKHGSLVDCIRRGTEDLVKMAEKAKSVELTLKFNKDSVPTVSYKVDELPLIVDEEKENG